MWQQGLHYPCLQQCLWGSKLRWRLSDQELKALNIEEVFYLATRGGGEFFGKVGTFEKGYEFDAVVLDDSSLRHPQELTVKERLERMIYLADDRNVVAKSVPRDKDGDETAIFGGNQ